MRRLVLAASLLAAALVAIVASTASVSTASAIPNHRVYIPSVQSYNVLAIAQELEAMQALGIITGGNDQSFATLEEALQELPASPAQVKPVTFDADHARQQGFSEAAIAVAADAVRLSNDLLTEMALAEQQGHTASLSSLPAIDMSKYPDFAGFTAAVGSFDMDSNQANLSSIGRELLGVLYCGGFGNPLPKRAAVWKTFNNIPNPAQTLRSWGYHPTPDWAGGGWTRPQTHLPLVCGWNTFRDHAYIVGNSIREQNYAGFTPRGEPNPEFWASGPWPYPLWPAYVAWWHEKY